MSWLQWKDDFEKCYKRKQWKIILFVIWICDMFPALQPNPALVKWTEPFLGAGMKLGQRKLFLSSHPHVLVLGDSLEDRKHWWRLSFWNVSADKRKKFQKTHLSLLQKCVSRPCNETWCCSFKANKWNWPDSWIIFRWVFGCLRGGRSGFCHNWVFCFCIGFSDAPTSLALMIVCHSLTDWLIETGDWQFCMFDSSRTTPLVIYLV